MILDLIKKIMATKSRITSSLLRAVIGWIFITAGTGKLFGWFGGPGHAPIALFFKNLGLVYPDFQAYMVGTTEMLGGLALLTGFLSRLASIPIIIIMIVAIITVDKNGNYYYPLLIILSCLTFIQSGSGPLSLDHLISEKIS